VGVPEINLGSWSNHLMGW